MTTTTSSSRNPIKGERLFDRTFARFLATTLRQNGLTMGIYGVCLILWTAMDTLSEVNQFDPSFQMAHVHLLTSSYAFLWSGFIVPVLLAALLFHYLHNRQSIDFYHSLPVSRTKIFFSRYLAGLILLLMPVAAAKLVCLILQFVHLYGPYYSAATLLSYAVGDMLFWMITYAVVFTLSCMVEVTASNDVEGILYSVAVNGLLTGLGAILSAFPNSLYGLRVHADISQFFSPYGVMSYYPDHYAYTYESPFQMLPVALVWLCIGALALLVTVKLYRHFQSEWAQQWGRQTFFTQLMKICAGILMAFILFCLLPLKTVTAKALLGAVIGAPLGFLMVEGVTGKGFHNLKRSLPAILLTLVICLTAPLFLATDGFGMVGKVPQVDDVQTVEVRFYGISRNHSYSWVNKGGNFEDNVESMNSVTLAEPEAISIVTQLHQLAVDNRNYLGETGNQMTFVYTLKGLGMEQRRVYSFPVSALPLIEELNCQPEVIEQVEPVFEYSPAVLEEVACFDKSGEELASIAPENFEQLLEAARTDLMSMTSNRLNDPATDPQLGYLRWGVKEYNEQTGVNLNLREDLTSLRNGTNELIIRSSYKHTLSLLKGWGIDLEQAEISAVERMEISMPALNDVRLDFDTSMAQPALERVEEPGAYSENLTWQIDDQQLIEQILQAATLSRTSISCNTIYLQMSQDVSLSPLRGPLYIENRALLSILKGSEVQIPYLLSAKEIGEFSESYQQSLPLDSRSGVTITTSYNPDSTNQFDIFDMEEALSVAEYARQNGLGWFAEKTEEQLAAMEYTVFYGHDHALFYQEHILP